MLIDFLYSCKTIFSPLAIVHHIHLMYRTSYASNDRDSINTRGHLGDLSRLDKDLRVPDEIQTWREIGRCNFPQETESERKSEQIERE